MVARNNTNGFSFSSGSQKKVGRAVFLLEVLGENWFAGVFFSFFFFKFLEVAYSRLCLPSSKLAVWHLPVTLCDLCFVIMSPALIFTPFCLPLFRTPTWVHWAHPHNPGWSSMERVVSTCSASPSVSLSHVMPSVMLWHSKKVPKTLT
jgi:hypothetical protein